MHYTTYTSSAPFAKCQFPIVPLPVYECVDVCVILYITHTTVRIALVVLTCWPQIECLRFFFFLVFAFLFVIVYLLLLLAPLFLLFCCAYWFRAGRFQKYLPNYDAVDVVIDIHIPRQLQFQNGNATMELYDGAAGAYRNAWATFATPDKINRADATRRNATRRMRIDSVLSRL